MGGAKQRKVFTILGIALILMPSGIIESWGNVSVYLYSYLFAVTGSHSVGVQSSWILSLVMTLNIAGLTFAEIIFSTLGKRLTALCGILLFSGGFVVSFFTIQVSFQAFTATLACLAGLSSGILEGLMLKYVIDWSDGDTGRMTSHIMASYSVGGVLVNQFVTRYTNPDNLTPDVVIDNFAFFTQTHILENVPYMLLWFGGLSFATQILGFVLLNEPPDLDSNVLVKECKHSKHDVKRYGADGAVVRQENIGKLGELIENGSVDRINNPNSFGIQTQIILTRESECNRRDNSELKCATATQQGDEGKDSENDRLDSNSGFTKYKPLFLEMSTILHSGQFYVLWFSYFFIDIVNISLVNFQKTYGQLFIHDDHFFSTMATVMALTFIVMRLIGGVILDKVHYKTLMVALLSLSSILQLIMYLSARGNRWFYFISTLSLGCVMSLIIQTWMVASLKVFGKKNSNASFSLVMTSVIADYLISAPIFDAILTSYGWFAVFLWPSGMSGLGLVITVVFLRHKDGQTDV